MDELLEVCRVFFAERRVEAYLVGGYVRDQALGRESRDYDFAVPQGALPLARTLADRLGGAYVTLDAERETGRVVLPGGANIDVALYRGATIGEDLAARDFTINAMARTLEPTAPFIDPHGGLRDLHARVVRFVSQGGFESDPVRIMRAVRLAAELGFAIEPGTLEALLAARPLLAGVSRERVRDELVRILELAQSGGALKVLAAWDMLALVMPGAAADEAAYERLGRIERFAARLSSNSELMDGDEVLRDELHGVINSGRPRLTVAKAAALYTDARLASHGLHGLRFGSHEAAYASAIVRHARRFESALQNPSRLEAHRFFRDSGPAGLTLLVMALGAAGDDGSQAVARQWLRWYRDEYEKVVEPRPLMDGAAIAARFGLSGPQIGRALVLLIEAQVDGSVTTPDEAAQFLTRIRSEVSSAPPRRPGEPAL